MNIRLYQTEKEDLKLAKVIKAVDHGNNVQLLCTDDRGLLSVYLNQKLFGEFNKMFSQTGSPLKGTIIGFDRDNIRVTSSGKCFSRKAKPSSSGRFGISTVLGKSLTHIHHLKHKLTQ